MGLLDNIKGAVPGADLADKAKGALGNVFTGSVKPPEGAASAVQNGVAAVQNGVTGAANWLKEKAIQAALWPLADNLDLNKSPNLNTFVEKGLKALDLYKGTPDGKPGKDTLDGINALRKAAGKEALTSVEQFTKDDLKLIIDEAGKKGTTFASNFYNEAAASIGGFINDFKKAPAAAPAPGPDMGGGGG